MGSTVEPEGLLALLQLHSRQSFCHQAAAAQWMPQGNFNSNSNPDSSWKCSGHVAMPHHQRRVWSADSAESSDRRQLRRRGWNVVSYKMATTKNKEEKIITRAWVVRLSWTRKSQLNLILTMTTMKGCSGVWIKMLMFSVLHVPIRLRLKALDIEIENLLLYGHRNSVFYLSSTHI